MKQKATRIGLALLVLLVWGAVIARAFQKPASDSAAEAPAIEHAPPPVEVAPEPLRFAIERDPFLDRQIEHPPVRTKPTTAHPPVKKPRPMFVAPPPAVAPKATIAYVGFIRRSGAEGMSCVILRINGREQVVAMGGSVQGIEVQNATAQVVSIRRNGEIEQIPIDHDATKK